MRFSNEWVLWGPIPDHLNLSVRPGVSEHGGCDYSSTLRFKKNIWIIIAITHYGIFWYIVYIYISYIMIYYGINSRCLQVILTEAVHSQWFIFGPGDLYQRWLVCQLQQLCSGLPGSSETKATGGCPTDEGQPPVILGQSKMFLDLNGC